MHRRGCRIERLIELLLICGRTGSPQPFQGVQNPVAVADKYRCCVRLIVLVAAEWERGRWRQGYRRRIKLERAWNRHIPIGVRGCFWSAVRALQNDLCPVGLPNPIWLCSTDMHGHERADVGPIGWRDESTSRAIRHRLAVLVYLGIVAIAVPSRIQTVEPPTGRTVIGKKHDCTLGNRIWVRVS